ncbi:MAG TPA: helix-turn-helix domain-containing protein [Planctomycetes bacterium]|nr:helix-turn-helix domain-containing protein [Planctomycetota bacterium]
MVDLESLVAQHDPEDDTDNSGVVVALPGASPLRVDTALRVVDGKGATSQVLVMPEKEISKPIVSAEEVARMVDELGATGKLLRSVREVRGLSLQDVANTTRIAARFLEAIEQEQLDDLPSLTFVRGYVREMARVLLLDEEYVVRGYMDHVAGKAK